MLYSSIWASGGREAGNLVAAFAQTDTPLPRVGFFCITFVFRLVEKFS